MCGGVRAGLVSLLVSLELLAEDQGGLGLQQLLLLPQQGVGGPQLLDQGQILLLTSKHLEEQQRPEEQGVTAGLETASG